MELEQEVGQETRVLNTVHSILEPGLQLAMLVPKGAGKTLRRISDSVHTRLSERYLVPTTLEADVETVEYEGNMREVKSNYLFLKTWYQDNETVDLYGIEIHEEH